MGEGSEPGILRKQAARISAEEGALQSHKSYLNQDSF